MKRPLTAIALALAVLLIGASVATGLPIAPYYTAPVCAVHDDRQAHGLWNSELGCHYDHTHGADPHVLDDKLGTGVYDTLGGEVSSPWQTFSASGTENELKHHGYASFALRDLPCTSTNRITDARGVVHQHPLLDFPVRYHSFWGEYAGCAPTGAWYAFVGGWHDTGDGLVNGQIVFDAVNDGNLERQHLSNNGTQVWYPCLHGENVLGNCIMRASLSIQDSWSPTTIAGSEGTYICYPNPACRSNASTFRNHLLQVEIVDALATAIGCAGTLPCNWEGYATRYGVPVSGCDTPSLDCVPMKFVNLPARTLMQCDSVCAQIYVDHDIYFCGVVPSKYLCTATSPGARPSGWQQPHH